MYVFYERRKSTVLLYCFVCAVTKGAIGSCLAHAEVGGFGFFGFKQGWFKFGGFV